MRTISAPRPVWLFSRADRLAALAARSRELAQVLYRERCDTPRADVPGRAALAARIAVHEARFRRFSALGRKARHVARTCGV